MLVLISYDVETKTPAGRKRLRRTAKRCVDYGQRVQNSVFECNIDPAQWAKLKAMLLGEINAKKDSLRFYYLGSNWKNRIEHVGAKEVVDLEEPLIV